MIDKLHVLKACREACFKVYVFGWSLGIKGFFCCRRSAHLIPTFSLCSIQMMEPIVLDVLYTERSECRRRT